MAFSRSSRVVTVLVALFSLLFMQLAVASYACPGMTKSGHIIMATPPDSADTAMPGCTGMDKEQPGLCHARAHTQDLLVKQALDQPQSPDVQPFVTSSFVLVVQAIEAALRPLSFQPGSVLLRRVTAPAIAILHCCFRF